MQEVLHIRLARRSFSLRRNERSMIVCSLNKFFLKREREREIIKQRFEAIFFLSKLLYTLRFFHNRLFARRLLYLHLDSSTLSWFTVHVPKNEQPISETSVMARGERRCAREDRPCTKFTIVQQSGGPSHVTTTLELIGALMNNKIARQHGGYRWLAVR